MYSALNKAILIGPTVLFCYILNRMRANTLDVSELISSYIFKVLNHLCHDNAIFWHYGEPMLALYRGSTVIDLKSSHNDP